MFSIFLLLKHEATSNQCVCVHENTFGVMCEGPTVELGEGAAQIRPLHHGQVCCVPTVHHIHHLHFVIDPLQHRPNDS